MSAPAAAAARTARLPLLLGLALACYLPFIGLGYGANADSLRVAETGRSFVATGVYTPSRYPGFPVHEIPAALLAHVGGAALSNAGTVAMAVLAVFSFVYVLRHFRIPGAETLAIGLIGNPVFWASATYTIDYVWSLALLLAGFAVLCRGRYTSGAILLGLAVGSRASSLGFAMAVMAFHYAVNPSHRLRIIGGALLVPLIGAAAHAWVISQYGWLRLTFGEWDRTDYVANFLFGNLMLLGPQACVALFALPLLRGRVSGAPPRFEPLAVLAVVIITGYELLYLWMPIQVGYLLPALPAVLLLLGVVLRHRPRVLTAWVALSVSASVLLVSPISVDGPVYRADSALPPLVELEAAAIRGKTSRTAGGLFIRWGYVISDAAARRRAAGEP